MKAAKLRVIASEERGGRNVRARRMLNTLIGKLASSSSSGQIVDLQRRLQRQMQRQMLLRGGWVCKCGAEVKESDRSCKKCGTSRCLDCFKPTRNPDFLCTDCRLKSRSRKIARKKSPLITQLPVDVWTKILQEYMPQSWSLSTTSKTHNEAIFQPFLNLFLKKREILVPQHCPTIKIAMKLAETLNHSQTYNTYTKEQPLRIVLDEGEHKIMRHAGEYGNVYQDITVTCNNITFVGKGKDKTTIRGGFKVSGKRNVKFEELTVSNPEGDGLYVEDLTDNFDERDVLIHQVELLKCAIKECDKNGITVFNTTIIATQCEFTKNARCGVGADGAYQPNTNVRLNDCTMYHNGYDGFWGLLATNRAVVDLHGEKTHIYSNNNGIFATEGGKVNIHLPSKHNTSRNNKRNNYNSSQDDEFFPERLGFIAYINADGTTEMVVDDD